MSNICMIPARIGSKRVPKKNLRILNGKPLIAYAILAAKEANIFDEIYVNSDDEIFAKIAKEYGVNFYLRPKSLGGDDVNNDSFLSDFIDKKTSSNDIITQLLPTSPLISSQEIIDFCNYMTSNNLDTLVSTHEVKIAALCDNNPINFKILGPHKSSQDMSPIQLYATVLMSWKVDSFKNNICSGSAGYHGGVGKTGYFPIKGLSTIDIDYEEDWELAELAMAYKNKKENSLPSYYGEECNVEVDVPSILAKDGVAYNVFDQENVPISNINDIIKNADNSRSWSHRLINTSNNSATLISQLPGEGNRLHHHPDWNEWWYIIDGVWKFDIEGESFEVRKGDVVFIEQNKWHQITAIGDSPAIRLAVSRSDVEHVYPER